MKEVYLVIETDGYEDYGSTAFFSKEDAEAYIKVASKIFDDNTLYISSETVFESLEEALRWASGEAT